MQLSHTPANVVINQVTEEVKMTYKKNVTYVYDQGIVAFTVEVANNTAREIVKATSKVMKPADLDQLGGLVSVEVEDVE